jgi:hypothetical protein
VAHFQEDIHRGEQGAGAARRLSQRRLALGWVMS